MQVIVITSINARNGDFSGGFLAMEKKSDKYVLKITFH